MKRIVFIVLALCLISTLCFGWGSGLPVSSQGSPWKSFAVTNTSGIYSLNSISTDIIPKGTSVLGYQILGIPGTNSENVCTIYDGGTSELDEVIGEAECVQDSKGGEWYPYPRTLEKQIYIHQGPATIVTIYFE